MRASGIPARGRLGTMLRAWRMRYEVTLRAMSSSTGISPATLMRIEQGRSIEALTWVKLQRWLLS